MFNKIQYIAHRINKIADLQKLDNNLGAEIDLRDHNGRIVLEHDPFDYKNADDFEEYLKHYCHGLLILNIKSERIEIRVLELLEKYQIKNYFFLDSSFPMIHKLSESGNHNIALRFSEFEGLDTLINMQSKVDWVWVDCFTKLPISKEIYKKLREMNYKLCLVSPELQGQEHKVIEYKKYLQDNVIQLDAICTKAYNVSLWKS